MTFPRFSLLHPSRGRVRLAAAAIWEWRARAREPSRIEHLLSVDDDDPDRPAYAEMARELGVQLLVTRNRSIVDAMNRAATASRGDVLVGISDDFGCPEAWDEALGRVVADDLDVAVHVHDGLAGRILTLPILGRRLWERLGFVYHPDYFSMYADDDLTDVTRALGKLVDARHLVFPHRHCSEGHAPDDPTYRRQNSGRAYRIGRRVYRRRQATRFGLAPPSIGLTLAVARIEATERLRSPVGRARAFLERVGMRLVRMIRDPAPRRAAVDGMAHRVRRLLAVERKAVATSGAAPDPGVPLPALGWLDREPAPSATPASEAYGFAALGRWREATQTIARPARPAADGTTIRFRTLTRAATPPATHPHTLVDVTNLHVDWARVGRRDALRHRPGYRVAPGVYADFRWGALSGLCTPADARMPIERLGRDHLRDLLDGFRWHADPASFRAADETADHPVLFVAREPHEYANLFHAHTDLLAVYEACRVLGLSADETQVILLDANPPGPFDEAFRRAFSRRHPVRRVEEHGGRRVRYRHAVFVPPGYYSFLHASASGGPVPAGMVDSLEDYAAYLLACHDVRPERRAPGAPVRATVIARRPGRAVDGRLRMPRRFGNAEAVVEALRSHGGIRVALVDLAVLPFAAQLRLVAETDLLVGAHGAGLAHLLCMPRGSAVVEVAPEPPPGASLPYATLYSDLASFRGITWTSVTTPEVHALQGSILRPDPAGVRAAAGRVLEACAGRGP
jgi:hypothetical protein